MPHVFTLSNPSFNLAGRDPRARPIGPPKDAKQRFMQQGAMQLAEGFGNALGDVGGETVRVIGMSAIGLALGYAAAYVFFMRR